MLNYKFKPGTSSRPKLEARISANENIPIEALRKARTLGFNLGTRISLKHYPNVFSDQRLRSNIKRV